MLPGRPQPLRPQGPSNLFPTWPVGTDDADNVVARTWAGPAHPPVKLEAGKKALRLFKDDYGDGSGWTSLEADLDAIKAAAKSGAKLQDSGAALVKYAKK